MAGEALQSPGPGTSRRCTASGTAAGLTDGQLLRRFADGRGDRDGDAAEAAFAALVARHGPMVLRTCRQVLGDDHDAQDACAGRLPRPGPPRRLRRRARLGRRLAARRRLPRRRQGPGGRRRRRGPRADRRRPGGLGSEADRLPAPRRALGRAARGTRPPAGDVPRPPDPLLFRGPDPGAGRLAAPLPARHGPEPAGPGPCQAAIAALPAGRVLVGVALSRRDPGPRARPGAGRGVGRRDGPRGDRVHHETRGGHGVGRAGARRSCGP